MSSLIRKRKYLALGYLLAGAVWWNLYQLLEGLVPGSFSVEPQMVGLKLAQAAHGE